MSFFFFYLGGGGDGEHKGGHSGTAEVQQATLRGKTKHLREQKDREVQPAGKLTNMSEKLSGIF